MFGVLLYLLLKKQKIEHSLPLTVEPCPCNVQSSKIFIKCLS